jgi:hypothetical protein
MDRRTFAKARGEMSSGEGGGADGTALAPKNNQSGEQSLAQKIDRKWRRILQLFVAGARLNRFDAERYGDHALNSTIAQIGSMGIKVSREPMTLTGRFGPIHCKRYWIDPCDRERAMAVLREGS